MIISVRDSFGIGKRSSLYISVHKHTYDWYTSRDTILGTDVLFLTVVQGRKVKEESNLKTILLFSILVLGHFLYFY